MTPVSFVLFALAGGLGAGARFVLDGVIRTRLRTPFPWATMIINVSGSLVLGLLVGLAFEQGSAGGFGVLLGTGFLGGYTTFSTASYETVQLLRQRRYRAAFTSGVLMLVLCVAAAALGLWLGSELPAG